MDNDAETFLMMRGEKLKLDGDDYVPGSDTPAFLQTMRETVSKERIQKWLKNLVGRAGVEPAAR